MITAELGWYYVHVEASAPLLARFLWYESRPLLNR